MAKDNLPENDIRLGELKEGAGLEDSRINQDFVDFIRKWSTPLLMVAAAIAIGYFLYNKRIEARQAHIDEAFTQYNQSANTFSPSPDALRRIAEDYDDVKGVSVMARVAAADEYLRSVQRGIRPGSPLDPQTGEPENEEDYLNDADRERLLGEAEEMYRQVWNDTQGNPAMAIHTLGALYGLAAVSESRMDVDAAKNALDQAMALAEDRGFIEHVALTRQRIEALPRLTRVSLPKKADLPPEPEPEVIPPLEGETEVLDEGPVGPQLPEGDAVDAEDGDAAASDGTGDESDTAAAADAETESADETAEGDAADDDGGDETGEDAGGDDTSDDGR